MLFKWCKGVYGAPEVNNVGTLHNRLHLLICFNVSFGRNMRFLCDRSDMPAVCSVMYSLSYIVHSARILETW